LAHAVGGAIGMGENGTPDRGLGLNEMAGALNGIDQPPENSRSDTLDIA
jgi:hypothetical protein